MSLVKAFWYLSSNAGDALTPWLIRLRGHVPVYAEPGDCRRIVGAGSIISSAKAHDAVWGSGIGSLSERVPAGAEILAVRGPLTRAAVHVGGGACPAVFGDPGLLAPLVYQPRVTTRRRIGIVAHYVDQERVFDHYAAADVALIDILQPPDVVIDAIASCDAVLSSSLHGIVFATAYEVPSVWVAFSDRLFGDGSKFADFMLSVGVEPCRAIDLRGALPGVDDLCRIGDAAPAPGRLDTRPLVAACPFWEAMPIPEAVTQEDSAPSTETQ